MGYKWQKEFGRMLDDVSSSLDDNDFYRVYKILDKYPGEYEANFTLFMLESGIDVLKYLDHVPDAFLFAQRDLDYKLYDISIPDNIKYIGRSAFEHSGIRSVRLDSEIDWIERRAFFYCENLTHVDLSKGVKTIGDYVFEGCKNLKQLILPNTLESIGATYDLNRYSSCEIIYLGSKKEWRSIRKNKGDYIRENRVKFTK